MSATDKIPGNVSVRVTTFMPDSQRIPKLIEIFDKSLKSIWSQWYESNEFIINDLQPGTYTLRLSMSSGIQKDETFELEEGKRKEITIEIGNNSPHESHEWAYLNKSFSIESIRDTDMKAIQYYKEPGKLVNSKIWKFSDGKWQQKLLPQFMSQRIRRDGNVFTYRTDDLLSVLEISGRAMPNLYVSLPPGNDLNCLVKLAEGEGEEIHPIDVTVSTDHFKAETLIALLTSGKIRQAKKLSNAAEAEELLYQKMVNPVAAAIGGYFLLKIGELERLHDWANNLANWFPWLPDGAIIHATQLLNKKEKTKNDIDLIRKRLLQAAGEGVPVYSEGLRLLEKGLTQLWYHSEQKDNEIKKAHDRIGDYLGVTDFSQETTTFIGISPSEPGMRAPKKIKV
ncbi:hypothetical protein [Dyadobacter arcticus]|uniref:Uncharacterized protein n=1 Tax=Dyadobacter arcticus TaxID=1078754 RepID=A0ABX0UNM2_9BACT|nr:hypothetical protein [Dyadobacter arcticus]NIJ54593.1 hypothetical protein [Dyadobacter arcticus]